MPGADPATWDVEQAAGHVPAGRGAARSPVAAVPPPPTFHQTSKPNNASNPNKTSNPSGGSSKTAPAAPAAAAPTSGGASTWAALAQRGAQNASMRPWWFQIAVVSQRSWFNHLRHPLNFASNFFTFFLLGTFTGFVYLQRLNESDENRVNDIIGALYFITMNAAFTTPFAVAVTFPRERALFRREHGARYYSVFAYWAATVLTYLPFQLIYSVCITIVSYWLSGLAASAGKFFFHLLVIFATLDCATTMGFAAGSISPNLTVAQGVLFPLILPWFTFGGLFVRDNAIPDYFIFFRYSSPFRYAFEALVVNELRDREFVCVEEPCGALTGEDAIRDLAFSKDMMVANVGIIFLISTILRVLTYAGLRLSARGG
jgi:hypothetical protein